jgi:O-antigen ligase
MEVRMEDRMEAPMDTPMDTPMDAPMDVRPEAPFLAPAAAWRTDTRFSVILCALLWTLIVLMIVPDGFDYASLATVRAPDSGGILSRLLWLILLGLGGLFTFYRAGLAWLLVRSANPFLFAFVILAAASMAWSIDMELSARRVLRLFTIVLVCGAFVLTGWHQRRFQNVVRPILTVMLAGSLLFGLFFPLLGIHQEVSAELAGAWRGLANHKNGLGALAGFGLIFWCHAWLAREVSTSSALLGAAFALACMVLSRSTTALFATLAVLALLVLILRTPHALEPYLGALITAGALVLGLYALAVLDVIPGLDALLTPITELTGKNQTLTGRTRIWSILFEHISQNPLTGTGFGAYWTANPAVGSDAYQFILKDQSFYPGSAHNGYLEVMNDLGWAGLACLVGYLVTFLRQTLRVLQTERTQGALYCALFFQQALTNLTESHWFSVLSVDMVLITLCTLALARGLLDERFHAALGAPAFAPAFVPAFVPGVAPARPAAGGPAPLPTSG